MKVYKFGGASVRNAEAVQNVASILENKKNQLLVVVSAMGKTTNMLEQIVELAQSGQPTGIQVSYLKQYHYEIADALFSTNLTVQNGLEKFFLEIEIEAHKQGSYDQIYDQVVSLGELISSYILSQYLNSRGIRNEWIDARQFIVTDNSFREGKVDWERTLSSTEKLKPILNDRVIVTQGFIGCAPNGATTTLGREGSDYSAAIFASTLKAQSATIWKDVPGVMNADPKRMPAAVVFEELPYKEAAEMTYFGASVIHPKTIKPLANSQIPLYVKSFVNTALNGTKIHECKIDHLPPLIVFKDNQCLISCKVTDYTFIDEQHLGSIFQALTDGNMKLNVMQNSAISFSFCVDFNERKIIPLIKHLSEKFEVFYNTNLTLITIKNYDQKIADEYRKRPGIILEQSSRSTMQLLIRDLKPQD